MSINDKPMHELIAMLAAEKVSVDEIVGDLYAAIGKKEETVHAFLALARPEELVEGAREKRNLPLLGIPIAVKDNICTVDFPTTCGSNILVGFRPPFDATAVEKLRAAGAQMQGKTNLDEFAMGSSTEHSAFGPTHNPHDPGCVPGGSSGGSAAAVASGEAIAALGTDTGGSVRQPAALCGVVGLRPTYGLISRFGLVAFASSLDTVGVLARCTHDAALILSIIAGHDHRDSTSLPVPQTDYTKELYPKLDVRIGIPKEYTPAELGPEVLGLIRKWREIAAGLGAEVVDIQLPLTEYALPCYYLIASAEAAANLARYDGVRYGRRVFSGKNVREMIARTRTAGFGREVKRRIALGTFALSAGYYDRYYGKAQLVRTLIAQEFTRAFQEVDLLIGPTSPTPAFRIGEKGDPLSMYLSDVFTLPSALAGLPAISIPGGKVAGLPFGLQITGPRLSEDKLLRAAYALEQALA